MLEVFQRLRRDPLVDLAAKGWLQGLVTLIYCADIPELVASSKGEGIWQLVRRGDSITQVGLTIPGKVQVSSMGNAPPGISKVTFGEAALIYTQSRFAPLC